MGISRSYLYLYHIFSTDMVFGAVNHDDDDIDVDRARRRRGNGRAL